MTIEAIPSTAAYRRVADANREFYRRTAHSYDASETCVNDREAQRGLSRDIATIVDLLDRPAHDIRALDACGGSGNVALKLPIMV